MTFRHEAALNTNAELNYIKTQINAGAEPWASNYSKMANSPSASLAYTPSTWATSTLLTNGGQVWQGIGGVPDNGGTALLNDSGAAYTQALMWEFTGNQTYAQNAIKIMNVWSYNLKSIGGANWCLLAGWGGSSFPLAAEIIRNTYSYSSTYPLGWTNADIAQFTAMLNTVFLPELNKRYGFGNRELAYCNALCAIGVFNNDRAAFYQGIYHWMSYYPCYVYMTADGAKPIVANYWVTEPTLDQYYAMHSNIFPNPANSWVYASNAYPPADVNPPAYPTEGGPYGDDYTAMHNSYIANDATSLWNGMNTTNGFYQGACAETCRDLGHVENSISEVFAVAELARVQGFDIYTGSKDRLAAFLEFQSSLRLGNPMPGGYTISQLNMAPTYEIGYNYLANVLGMNLPYTQQLINPIVRSAQWFYIKYGIADYYHEVIPHPAGLSANCPVLMGQAGTWETLTHGNLNGSNPGPDPNVALGMPATASSTNSSSQSAGNVTDGNLQTNWTSLRSDPQWIYVDLGSPYNITGVTLYWVTASSATAYSVQTSNDAVNWTSIYNTTTGVGGVVQLTGLAASGRYVRMYGTARNSTYGYALDEIQVFGTPAIPTAGLVGYYRFEQNTTDSSGSGNNGTAQTGFSYSTDSAEGAYSGQCDGNGGRVVVPDSASLRITGNLTVASWVKVNSYSNNPDFVAKSYNSGYRLVTYTSGGIGYVKVVLGKTDGTTALFYGNQPIPTGMWTHVAATVTISGSTAGVQFYVNGVAGNIAYNTMSAINAGTGSLVLGARQDATGSSEALNGNLDQVTIYNRALSAAEILQLAQ